MQVTDTLAGPGRGPSMTGAKTGSESEAVTTGAKVLVVDDDPQIREVLRIALGQAGFEVAEAADGAAGLKEAGKGPDLVVLDIGLPERDGLDVCRELRRTSQVPVLFLTARDDEVDRIVGLELGADDYVTKPFSATELRSKIEVATFAPRDFVVAEGYVGPDRRHRKASFDGSERRGHGPLTQSEIDSMMAG